MTFDIEINSSNEVKGIVFDFQRFALHDGPGIRSVVFLKGCPLRCIWCCNPESQEMGIEEITEKNSGEITKAYGYEMSSLEVVRQFLCDADYYRNSNGGITLSGGEPLFQFDFALDILQKSKAANLHTAIETTGHIPTEQLKKMLPYTDLFLYDYKMTDDSLHKEFTGVSNQKIIENLHFILRKGATVYLRCIVIPGINDNNSHFKAIVELTKHYPNLEKVELMPYHEFGRHKYEELGKEYYDFGLSTTKREIAQEWEQRLKFLGCEKVSVS